MKKILSLLLVFACLTFSSVNAFANVSDNNQEEVYSAIVDSISEAHLDATVNTMSGNDKQSFMEYISSDGKISTLNEKLSHDGFVGKW